MIDEQANDRPKRNPPVNGQGDLTARLRAEADDADARAGVAFSAERHARLMAAIRAGVGGAQPPAMRLADVRRHRRAPPFRLALAATLAIGAAAVGVALFATRERGPSPAEARRLSEGLALPVAFADRSAAAGSIALTFDAPLEATRDASREAEGVARFLRGQAEQLRSLAVARS